VQPLIDLEVLATLVANGDMVPALDEALAAWRIARAAVLADIVDAVSVRVDVAPIAGDDPPAFHAAWLARAKLGRAADAGVLLQALMRALPGRQKRYWEPGTAAVRYAALLERYAALDERGDDPRAARRLLTLLEQTPITGGWLPEDTATVYDPAVRLVARAADERLLDDARRLAARPTARAQVVRAYLASAMPDVVARTQASIDARARSGASFDADLAERILADLGGPTRQAARPTRGDEEALFAEVCRDPDDDGPREVLGDLWTERGDPRGELVSLQMALARGRGGDAEQKKARAIVRAHDKAWLGDLALVTKSRVFARGFLESFELLQNAAADAEAWTSAAQHPGLGTVREITKGKANETHYRRFVFSPAASALRSLVVISKAMLADVCARGTPWTISRLTLAFAPDKKSLELVDRTASLPHLTELIVGTTAAALPKVTAMCERLERLPSLHTIGVRPLRWYDETEPLAEWLDAARGRLARAGSVLVDADHERAVSARRGQRGGLVLDLVTAHLYFGREFLPLLRDVEALSLRLPDGVDAPLAQDASDAWRTLRSVERQHVTMDAGWRALLRPDD
jgi:uncharacterized protein (TIGR02996 family)